MAGAKKVQPKKAASKKAAPKRAATKSTRESLRGGKKSMAILPV
ncbi:MAG: hypothetical protein ACKO8G_02345 [Actinomycetota bacterium]